MVATIQSGLQGQRVMENKRPMRCRVSCVLVLLFLLQLSVSSGCAAYKAAHQPGKKNMSLLSPDTPRALIIAELGQPVHTENKANQTVDTFAFKQGYSRPEKMFRTAGHIAGDVFTLGLWEIVGLPIETAFAGEQIKVQVSYDANQNVNSVRYFEGRHVAETNYTAPRWMQPPEWMLTRRDPEFGGSSESLDGTSAPAGEVQIASGAEPILQ